MSKATSNKTPNNIETAFLASVSKLANVTKELGEVDKKHGNLMITTLCHSILNACPLTTNGQRSPKEITDFNKKYYGKLAIGTRKVISKSLTKILETKFKIVSKFETVEQIREFIETEFGTVSIDEKTKEETLEKCDSIRKLQKALRNPTSDKVAKANNDKVLNDALANCVDTKTFLTLVMALSQLDADKLEQVKAQVDRLGKSENPIVAPTSVEAFHSNLRQVFSIVAKENSEMVS
tara:strand:- start:346 stop:1056 length:711 start_codon:yes stop_codon:yes gene_type:complete